MRVGTIAHLTREVGHTGLLMVIEIGEKISMGRGNIAARSATLGTGEKEKVALVIRRDIIEAFTKGHFSLA